MEITTRAGSVVSSQISKMGAVSLDGGEFRIPGNMNKPFNIKNDGDEAVELEVLLDRNAEGDYVTTKFEPGWNPEIVRAVKSGDVTNIKWGY